MKFQPRKSQSALFESLESRKLFSTVMPAVVHPAATGSPTETASASIVATQLTSTTYQYAVTVTDTAAGPATKSNQVGTFWYAWVPGFDYLDTAPLSVSAPAGWTDQIVHAGPGDGYSIQWVASSNAIQAGRSLSGFDFISTDTPAQVFGKSNFYPTTNVDTAFVYAGAPETDAGFSLVPATSVATAPAPVQTPPASSTPVAKETASASIVAKQLTSTTFRYSITLKNTSHGKANLANQIGTFWYAWVPDEDFLDTAPLTVSAPKGWTDKITNVGSSDGFAVQFVTKSKFLKAGKSLTGFTFTSTDTPSQVFGDSKFYPTTPVNTSFVYSGAPFSDTGFAITKMHTLIQKSHVSTGTTGTGGTGGTMPIY